MPTLDWIGKRAVVNHHQDVPFHLLRDVPALGCGPVDSGIYAAASRLSPQRLKALGITFKQPPFAIKVR